MELVRPVEQQRRCALYRHFDDEDILLYVGITDNLADRTNSGHARTSDWVQFAVRAEAEWYDSREAASNAEREAVREEQPIYNRQYAEWDADFKIAEYLHHREVRALTEVLGEYERAVKRFLASAPERDVKEAEARASDDYSSAGLTLDRALPARVLHHLGRMADVRAADIVEQTQIETLGSILKFVEERIAAVRVWQQAAEEPPF